MAEVSWHMAATTLPYDVISYSMIQCSVRREKHSSARSTTNWTNWEKHSPCHRLIGKGVDPPVRTHVSTYVRACVRAYLCSYERTYTRTYWHSYACTHLCSYARTYEPLCVRTYVCTYVCAYLRTYVATYIRTCVLTRCFFGGQSTASIRPRKHGGRSVVAHGRHDISI